MPRYWKTVTLDLNLTMFPSINSYSILYTLFAWFLGMCYGFVLLSSAAGQNSEINIFKAGESLTYQYRSSVLLNEKDNSAKNVGYYIDANVIVDVVWEKGYQKLLKIVFEKTPELHIRSRKSPAPDGFIPHTSKLDNADNKPFLVVWANGKIEKLFLPEGEIISLKNIKKGIASSFQFHLLDGNFSETDASGKCEVTYTSTSPTSIVKTKTSCISQDFQYIKNSDGILGTQVNSFRQAEYELDSMQTQLKSIKCEEKHSVFLSIREEIGSNVEADQRFTLLDNIKTTEVLQEDNLEKAVERVSKSEGVTFSQDILLTQREEGSLEDVVSLPKLLDSLRDYLKTANLGTLKPAKAFLKLVNTARISKKDEISKALTSKKNKQILNQLYDIMGYVQTKDSHAAVMKILHFDKEEMIDSSERYLWALSFSPQPNSDIIVDLLKKYKKLLNIPVKVKETLVLTIASMANKLSKLVHNDANQKVIKDVEESILNGLEYDKSEDRFVFFRALKNLNSPTTIPILLKFVRNGTQKEGVLAWKAIRSFSPTLWNTDVLKAAEKSFFQLDRKYDTSSRTLAADILVESQPNDQLLEELLNFLISNDPAYEIKQYTLQRIKMIADGDATFKQRVERLIKSNEWINNYSGLSPRGLSTSLSRRFLTHQSGNGSLISVQEMKSGIVKRGTVNVVLEKEGIAGEVFSLGIFSGGLNSFISSDSEAEQEAEEESVTAGMELAVLGTQIRPFVFFNGQGELMGHVWSGTASEMTPAFQALVLVQDHLEYIRLSSGFIAELNLKGAASFDLSGKIEISLWNRNAESLVQKSAGIVMIGSIIVDTIFVKACVEYNASIETKLNLQTDIDFSSEVQLCMRLTQPDALFRHNIFKVERIPASKHKLRISKYKKFTVPGTTYSINRKNDEMCSAIFSNI